MILFTSLTLLSFLANTLAFHHPGLLVTNEDLSRAKTKVAAEEDPWLSSWNKLISLDLSQTSWRARPVRTVSRGTNGELLWQDAAAAFNLAIRWKISGDDQYADAASGVLVSWASTLQSLSGGGDDDYLTAGLQGYQLANAAELLRDYLPFAENDFSAIKSMLTTIFLPMNLDFLNHRLGSTHIHKHFFANWEQANLACVMAIGVLTENSTTWDFALDYFKTGSGNGGIYNGITNIVREPGTGKPLGQGQESGRDQGHSSLNFQLLGVIGQQAWNQDVDLFSFADSRILLGAEYFARYNLGHDVPFEPYTNTLVTFDKISDASRGAVRPTWELLYAHYVQIKGLSAPWTTAYLNHSLVSFGGVFEGGAGSYGEGSGHYDGVGWGSLLHHLGDEGPAHASSSTSAISSSSTSAISSSSTSAISSSSASLISTSTRTHHATETTTHRPHHTHQGSHGNHGHHSDGPGCRMVPVVV